MNYQRERVKDNEVGHPKRGRRQAQNWFYDFAGGPVAAAPTA